MSRMIMIDLETFGSVPGCSIAAIGAVAASHDGIVSNEFYEIVSRSSCAEHGLHESAATLEWWGRQSAAAQAVITLTSDPDRALSLRTALIELNSFVKLQGNDVEVFGNAQGFPAGYVLDPIGPSGKPLSISSSIRMIGNSVCPDMAEALARANVCLDRFTEQQEAA